MAVSDLVLHKNLMVIAFTEIEKMIFVVDLVPFVCKYLK